jgi:hypothetical protein
MVCRLQLLLVAGLLLSACTSFEGAQTGTAGAGGENGSSGGGAGSPGGSSGGGGALPPTPCSSNADCEDLNPCTAESCTRGFCLRTSLPKGTSCSDQNLCNGDEVCDGNGVCADAPDLVIDDGKVCTNDLCDPATGAVSHQGIEGCACTGDADCGQGDDCTTTACVGGRCKLYKKPTGTPCDDSNACTSGDRCDTTGRCTGTPLPVDDGNLCTVDSCDPATGALIHASQPGKPCDDKDACTTGDACTKQDTCKGLPRDISDGNDCTEDICDPITGTVFHKGQNNCQDCQSDGDCDDNNPCTSGSCKAGKCTFQALSAGVACNDGNACTSGDACDGSGKCIGTFAVVPDGNPCTKDGCNPQTGKAEYTPLPGESCNDGSLCTTNDKCSDSGACVGVKKSIDDGDSCTDDLCDPATGNVTHVKKSGCKACSSTAECDDSNPCTKDECTGGFCVYSFLPSGAPCNDGNACTSSDRCNSSGACSGDPKNVEDGNPCTHNECDPATGEIITVPGPSVPCNDGNPCTDGDSCSQGACKGTPKLTNDGNPCTKDSCDPATGTIINQPIGGCTSCTSNSDCQSNNPCISGSCVDGKCSYSNASAGTLCNDGNACTSGDQCNGAGQCVGTTTPCNSPPSQCHIEEGVCNPASGVCDYTLKGNGSPCSDGNPCTQSDQCTSGTCIGSPVSGCKVCGSNSECNDFNGCTDDACSGGVCVNQPNTSPCDDGNSCTQNDTCSGGYCSGSPIGGCQNCTSNSQCEDGNPCTTDVCSGGVCVRSNNANACNDNNNCTINDKCNNGACVGSAACEYFDYGCIIQTGACNQQNGSCEFKYKLDGTFCIDPCYGNGYCYSGYCVPYVFNPECNINPF